MKILPPILSFAIALGSCGLAVEMPGPQEASLTSKEFQAAPQGGQLPEKVLQQASVRYGGSFEPKGEAGQAQTGRLIAFGKINAENTSGLGVPEETVENRVRETVIRRLSRDGISLAGSPAKGRKRAPASELARKGIRLILHGVASYNDRTRQTTVFLRAVETATGKNSVIASGRGDTPEQAAEAAAIRLVKELNGGQR